jgi:hypothetical protein
VSRAKLKTEDAARLVAGPDMTPEQAAVRLRRLTREGIAKPVGRAGKRCDARDGLLFDQAAPAIVTILFWLHDHAGFRDKKNLESMWAYLAESFGDEGGQRIDAILWDVAAGGTPFLILTAWQCPHTADVAYGCTLRFTDELERPIAPPFEGFEPRAEIVLDLAKHLARFAGTNVVALKALH